MPEVIGVITCVVVLVLLFTSFFGDVSGFFSCLRYWLMPDIISMVRGQWSEDMWAEMKLFVWLGCGAGAGYGAYSALLKITG